MNKDIKKQLEKVAGGIEDGKILNDAMLGIASSIVDKPIGKNDEVDEGGDDDASDNGE